MEPSRTFMNSPESARETCLWQSTSTRSIQTCDLFTLRFVFFFLGATQDYVVAHIALNTAEFDPWNH